MSVATISRVINNIETVRPETAARVLETIEKLNYQPNFTGRNLRTKETRLILVVLPTIVNPFFAKVVKGMEDSANENDYNILICTTYENKKIEYSHLKLMQSKLVDGVIFLGTSLSEAEFISFSENYPTVQCSEYFENIHVPYVSVDNEQAAYDSVKHLIDRGCKRILEFSADNNTITTTKRRSGYLRALSEANLTFSATIKGNYGYRSSMRLLNNRLKSGLDFDGIFTVSDRTAAGCIRSLLKHEINVPDDVKVTGFDNVEISYTTSPEITTVSQSQHKMGHLAVELLIKKIRSERVEEKNIINHKLIIRESTKEN